MTSRDEHWPALPPTAEWQDTLSTVHMWTQVVGKIRLAQAPMVNHWWQVPLYVTTRGLTTSPVPADGRIFQIDFDFTGHTLAITTGDGGEASFPLDAYSVAEFYRRTMDALRGLGINVEIWTTPVEVPDRTPFEESTHLASYDAEAVNRFWRALAQADRVLKRFRGGFTGKASPVHFFWGAFDLAATRYSGRPGPEHSGAPNVARWVMVEAYSEELSSAGFWPGGGELDAHFYAYAYPEPDGFRTAHVEPEAAYYSETLGEYLLPYEAVRTAPDPDDALLRFLQTTYDAAADLGGWDRAALERGMAATR